MGTAVVELRGFAVETIHATAKTKPVGQQKQYYYDQIISTLGTSWRVEIRIGKDGTVVYRANGGAALTVVSGKLVMPLQFQEPPLIKVASVLTAAYFVLVNPNNVSVALFAPIRLGEVAGNLASDKDVSAAATFSFRNGGVLMEAPSDLDVAVASGYLPAQLPTDMSSISDARPLINTLLPVIATENMYGYVSPEYVDSAADFIAPMFRFAPVDPRNQAAAPNSRLEVRNFRLIQKTGAVWEIKLASAVAADFNAQIYYPSTGVPGTRTQAPTALFTNSIAIGLDEFRNIAGSTLLGFLNGTFFLASSGLKSVPYHVQMEARKTLINASGNDDRSNVPLLGQVFGDWRYSTTRALVSIGMIGDSMTAGQLNNYYSDVPDFAALLTAGGWTGTFVGIEGHTAWTGGQPVMANGGWTMATVTTKFSAIATAAPKHLFVNLGYNDVQIIATAAQVTTDTTTFYDGLFTATAGISGRVIWACIPFNVGWLDQAKFTALANAIIAWVQAGDGISRRLVDLRKAQLDLVGADSSGDGAHWSAAGAVKIARVKYHSLLRYLNEVAFQGRWKTIPNNGNWTLLTATNISTTHPYFGDLTGALTAQQLLDGPPMLP